MPKPGFLDFDEARARARRFLPRALFGYIDRGTEGEVALRTLRRQFDDRRVVPRILEVDAAPDLSASLLGKRYSSPFVVAPTALAGLVRYDGEVKMALAAREVGMPFCVSTQSSTSIEAIVERAPAAEIWFQLYVWRDYSETWRLLDRVAGLGIDVLVLTVDTPMPPKKVHNIRNGFAIPCVLRSSSLPICCSTRDGASESWVAIGWQAACHPMRTIPAMLPPRLLLQ